MTHVIPINVMKHVGACSIFYAYIHVDVKVFFKVGNNTQI